MEIFSKLILELMDKVYNPETKRYIKRDSKKGVEILFKNNDKEILKLFELINGKIIKKCLDRKIRNPKTLRCVNKKPIKEPKEKPVKKLIKEPKEKPVKKPIKEPKEKSAKKPNSLSIKIKAINKIKKVFSPFVKRISPDIYTRVRYMMMMRRELKKVIKKNYGCLKIYKKNPDGTYKYRIGSKIILIKRIGSPSKYGEAYLSEFRDKSKKLLTFVSKIYEYEELNTMKELKLMELLTNKVRMSECPHFPIIYGYVKCDNIYGSDSFKKSNSKSSSITQSFNKYPDILKKINKRYLKHDSYKKSQQMMTLFNELANGDFKSFMNTYQDSPNCIQLFTNSLVQTVLSIIYFYYHTNMTHEDTHTGNFLYHKIKKGGYFHYKIFDQDLYLKNLGFLWVIWDYEFAKSIKDKIKQKKNDCKDDFLKLFLSVLPNYKLQNTDEFKGFNNLIKLENRAKLETLFINIYIITKTKIMSKENKVFTRENLINFIEELIELFINLGWLSSSITTDEKVINEKPFVIGKDFLKR